GIAMLAGLVLLSLGACKKDENVTPTETTTPQADLSKSVNFQSTTLATGLTNYKTSPVINYNGKHDITISGLSISGGTVPSITLTNCYNIHITHCSLGNSSNVAINMYNCHNITVDYSYFTNASTGIYVVSTTLGGIVIQFNQFLNMKGPYPRGQAIQFNQVSGAGNKISYNKMQNIAGQSNTYESVNIYKSHGTSTSPILITGNSFRGGGPNSASAALQLGDNGGSYITATGNAIVNSGAVGISVSGGDHIVVTNNSIYSSQTSYANVGICVWAQAGYAITNCTVSGNKVNWTSSAGKQNNCWIGPSTAMPSGWTANTWSAALNSSLLPTTLVSTTAATVPL
ncbi:MAG: hypothetical protein ACXVI9_05935, partial [Mucilaginibacter sp.]